MRPSFFLATALTLASTVTAQAGQSGFGASRTRGLAELGILPTPADVIVTDIVNYHRHRLPLPRAGEDLALDVRAAGGFDRRGELVLQIGYTTAPSDDRSDLPALDLALVIDVSGSMEEAGKLTAVKSGLLTMIGRLRPSDRVALVTFDNEARVIAPTRSLGDGCWLRDDIASLQPGSGTNLHGGLMLGLRQVGEGRTGVSRRVILLTDGIANQGIVEPAAILRDAAKYTNDGIDLSTIGVGRDVNTDLLTQLARGGRGVSHFLADPQEVRKVFVDELGSLLAPVARHVRLRVVLPPGLMLLQSFGQLGERSSDEEGFDCDLADLNRGATGVVLLRCRKNDAFDLPRHPIVRARLTYADRDGGSRQHVEGELDLHASLRDETAFADPEVKKNFTIAVLADAIHGMAIDAEAQRWAAADTRLRRALDFAREQFPNTDDADVRRVREMADGHAQTLRRHLDRFRDQ